MIILGVLTILWGVVGGFDFVFDTIHCMQNNKDVIEEIINNPQLIESVQQDIINNWDTVQQLINEIKQPQPDFSSYNAWKQSMLQNINVFEPHEALDLSRQCYVDSKYPNLNEIEDWDILNKAQNELFSSDSE